MGCGATAPGFRGSPPQLYTYCFLGGAGGTQGGGIVLCQKLMVGDPDRHSQGNSMGVEGLESRDQAKILPGILMANPWLSLPVLTSPHAGVHQGHRCGVLGGTTLGTPGAGKGRGQLPRRQLNGCS